MSDKRPISDWALFFLLASLWASAYALNRLAVSTGAPEAGLPPVVVISTRLTLAAVVLIAVALVSRQAWPALTAWRSWLAMAVMGILGTAAPFLLITTAQKTVDSSLAALYVAATPLFVAVMAHAIFADDRMTARKVVGLVIGFSGVAVLFGPDAVAAFGSASVVAQALCLFATCFYALSTIVARIARNIPPFVFSAGFVSFGAIATWPFLIAVDWASLSPSASALSGVIGLALGPTALASVVYMMLIRRASATFVSLTGYMIPIISAVVGFLAFGEVQGPSALLAFALILGGVWLTQRSGRAALSS